MKRSHLFFFVLWLVAAVAILIFTAACTSTVERVKVGADDSVTKATIQFEGAASRTIEKAVTQFEGAASRIITRVENDTLPKARAATKGILDDIANWWDRIGMGLITLVSVIYSIVKGKSANLHKKALGTVVEAGEKMNGGSEVLKRHVESILKAKLPPKAEYAIRALIRAAKKGK